MRLAELIRSGQASSREIVEAHIERIRRVNPVINALVAERFEKARREADRADEAAGSRPGRDLPPFHGVPCTIKESFSLEGMPWTGGLVSRRGIIADSDATAVGRLRSAGAIPVGVTNVSELCMWMETNNRVYGRTRNPYDPTRIVGGSSGGEGALIGAGGAPFGLGADIGGSIRLPAFFNGVFGHKPTGGLIPNTGQFPNSRNLPFRLLVTGPLARRAEDLWPLVRILAGPDGEDPSCAEFPLGDPAKVDLAKLRVIVVEADGVRRVSDDLRRALGKCADHLASKGAAVRRTRIEDFRESFDIWSSMMVSVANEPFRVLMGWGGRPVNPFAELLRWALRSSEHTFPAIALAILEYVPRLTPWRVRRFVRLGCDLRARLTDIIGREGILLYPPYVSSAPRHDRPLFPPFNWVYTAIFNAMELPVTQVPVGLDREGLPLGVQVVSIPGNDHVTIAAALELEKAFGGWVEPSGTGREIRGTLRTF